MRHHLQEGNTTVACRAKLIFFWSGAATRNNKVTLTSDLQARLEVSLIGKHFLEPANIPEGDPSSVLTNNEMMLRLAGLHVRPTATNKTGLNFSDFEIAKADGALLETAHGALTFRCSACL